MSHSFSRWQEREKNIKGRETGKSVSATGTRYYDSAVETYSSSIIPKPYLIGIYIFRFLPLAQRFSTYDKVSKEIDLILGSERKEEISETSTKPW